MDTTRKIWKRTTSFHVKVKFYLLIALLLAAITIGSSIAIFPVWQSVATICILLLISFAFLGVKFLNSFAILMLVSKPLIDLSWQTRFFHFSGQGVNIQSAVGVFAILVTLAAILTRPKAVVGSKAVCLFLCVALLSVIVVPTSVGVNELIRLFSGVSLFFIAGYALNNEKTFETFAKWFIAAVSIPVILSLMQVAGWLNYEYWDWIAGRRVGRVSGTYQHPLGLIFYLIYAFPIALYLLGRVRKHLYQQILLIEFLALATVALILTYHRTGLIVIAIEILLWLILTGRYKLAAVLMILGSCLMLGLKEKVIILYGNLFDILSGEIDFSNPAFLRGRSTNWYLFLSSFLDADFFSLLIGQGSSTAAGFVPNFGYYSSVEPHNDFIRILHAYGLIGITLYVSILIRFCIDSFQLRRTNSRFSQDLGNVMVVAVVSFVLLSITTEPMRYPTAAWYLFALGSAVAVRRAKYHRPTELSY